LIQCCKIAIEESNAYPASKAQFTRNPPLS
jgi:hypothetical protein